MQCAVVVTQLALLTSVYHIMAVQEYVAHRALQERPAKALVNDRANSASAEMAGYSAPDGPPRKAHPSTWETFTAWYQASPLDVRLSGDTDKSIATFRGFNTSYPSLTSKDF